MRLLLLAVLLVPLVLASGPVVKTKQGQVEGFYYPLSDGRNARLFFGVPFGKPPVGDLRFEVRLSFTIKCFVEASTTRQLEWSLQRHVPTAEVHPWHGARRNRQ